MSIITITLRKGGSGKTASCVNLAAAFVEIHKKKVLLIDLDPQATATDISGINQDNIKHTSVELLYNSKLNMADAILKTSIGYDIVGLNQNESKYILGLQFSHIPMLSEQIDSIKDKYDYIILDSPPGESILSSAAYYASEYALLSIEASKEAYETIGKTVNEITEMKERLHRNIKILGMFFNKYDSRLVISKYYNNKVKNQYGCLLLNEKIRNTTKYKDCAHLQQSMFQYDRTFAIEQSGYVELSNYIIKEVNK